MWNILLYISVNAKQLNFERYTIGAEGKIKINEARGDFFFTLMSRFGGIFLHLPVYDVKRVFLNFVIHFLGPPVVISGVHSPNMRTCLLFNGLV